jgi:hypothetical protein
MRNKWVLTGLVALPLAVAGGLVYANTKQNDQTQPRATGYVCPITGETLPCPNCCPLNDKSE